MNFLLFIWTFSTCRQVNMVINGNIHYSIFIMDSKVVWNAWLESSNSGYRKPTSKSFNPPESQLFWGDDSQK